MNIHFRSQWSGGGGRIEPASLPGGYVRPTGRPTRSLTLALPLLIALVGCDLSVSNPGPIEDQYLDAPGVHPALAVGAKRALAIGLSNTSFYIALFAREAISSGGGTRPAGAPGSVLEGWMDLTFHNPDWTGPHTARWLAEDAVRRMTRVLGADAAASDNVMQANVWAGFANRFLGENMCDAVIDGGAPEDHKVHFQRAEEYFTAAINSAASGGNSGNLRIAARAGRASVRAALGRWADAAADAEAVPSTFNFSLSYSNRAGDPINSFAQANAASPYRRLSVRQTYFENYFLETGDRRTPWGRDPARPVGENGSTPWLVELKHAPGAGAASFALPVALSATSPAVPGRGWESPITLTSGREMRLLLAEARLRAGDRDGAMALLNARRAELSVPPRTAATNDEAWTALKLERFIELWLEGRALWDHRRYTAEGTPGPLPSELSMSGRALCFPIMEVERSTNRNIPKGHP